jgi:hypothetical protein
METLEHAALAVRVLARSLHDSSRIDSDASPVRDAQTRERLAGVLGGLATALRTYGRLVQALPSGNEPLASELAAQLADAHRHQDLLAAMLEPRTAPDGASSEWPLRGEILSHVDRLRTGLQVEAAPIPRRPARPAPGTRPPGTSGLHPRPGAAREGRPHLRPAAAGKPAGEDAPADRLPWCVADAA